MVGVRRRGDSHAAGVAGGVRHLPATREEMHARGWDRLDVILVTGDAHVDHPSFPAALLGRWLEAHGFRVGVLARPDPALPGAIERLGLPRLFFGVTAGALDSMVANYTAQRRRRADDPYAPGGVAGGRPDRAITVYCNRLRRAYGRHAFVVAGGLEASLRRFAHYDYWSDSVRRPLLMDCGADVLVHGMGEGPLLEIARRLEALEAAVDEARGAVLDPRARRDDPRLEAIRDVPGVVFRSPASEPRPREGVALPSMEEVAADAETHARTFHLYETSRDERQWQECAGMRVVANPPWPPLGVEELDAVYALPFTREVHPVHGGERVPALEQVRFSVTAHRGCCGGCAFCAIGSHQGRTVQSRSEASVLEEVERIAAHPQFRGTVPDVGGPTANLYGATCGRGTPCRRVSCLWPRRCPDLRLDQGRYVSLLRKAARTRGVRHLFVTTGVRMDVALESRAFVRALTREFMSGRLKVAPEHLAPHVLALMRKPAGGELDAFLGVQRRAGDGGAHPPLVLPYLMAAHPGSRLSDMVDVALFLKRRGIRVEQVQIFTPTPGTAATAMYATGLDPATRQPVFVERDPRRREMQKSLLLWHLPERAADIREALRI
ncbi:MAG: YgiQ family radical SAM protein, partial [Deltaproteobacteria bacterium]|nr:YgiQ family radical SAM protein [Deltaproteobacteria bacterium]